jgi:hypothetical protein
MTGELIGRGRDCDVSVPEVFDADGPTMLGDLSAVRTLEHR